MNILLKNKLVSSAALAAIVTVLTMGPGCGDKGTTKVAANALPPPAVVVAEVAQKTVPIYAEFVGQTKAQESVDLKARVAGILEKIHFKEGTPVKNGELLFSIDKSPYEAALQSAKAGQSKAQADLAQAEQRVEVLQAQAQVAEAEAAHVKAQQDLARAQPLAKERAVTELELDAATANEKTTQATLDAKKAQLKDVEASYKYTIERAQAQVTAAKAAVTEAQLNLSYCSVHSPIDGIVGFRQVDEGNLVGKGEATLLGTVSKSEPLLVDFNVSETDYLRIVTREKVGTGGGNLRFELILSDGSIHPYPGTFRVIDRTVDPQTGTMKVEASFPNPKSYLRPGQFARVRVAVSEQENAILVPRLAIQELQGAKTVLVVDD